jgi:hypothetical protein
MKKILSLTIAGSTTLVLCSAAVTTAFAMDPVCNQVKTATQLLKTVPFHIYITETRSFANSAVAKAGAQIGMGGTKQVEEISTGKSIYVLTNGKWVDMQTSFAAMEDDKYSDPDTLKAIEESKCKALPDEAMYGQSARVFFQSIPGLGIETKLWISKSTNLPLRSDMTNDGGAMKMMTVSRYEYDGVRAPAQTVTMKDMVKSSKP